MEKKIKIAIADDHVLLRKGLAELINGLGYLVILECSSGKELVEKIQKENLPDLIIMDINMPVMDGYATTRWVKEHYPLIHILALSMFDDEHSIIRMLKYGARGYLIKDAEPLELKKAIDDIIDHGVHYSEQVSGKLLHSIYQADGEAGNGSGLKSLSEREIEFLRLASTELTYKEIADKMYLSPRTIDGYRDDLFEKLNVKNRIGLVLFAIKHRIAQID